MSKYFKYPFAESGDKVEIKDGMQPSGVVSYQQGWGYDYQRKLGEDTQAKPVPRQQSNQLNYDITSAIKQYQEHGFYDFITPEMNGGEPFNYSMGSVVRFDMSDAQDGSDIRNFTSRINNNTGNPKDHPDDWSDSDANFATNEEAQAGVVSNKVISPSNLASVTATEARKGLVQLATNEEVIQGTDITKAITPASFLNAFSDSKIANTGYQILPSGLIMQWGLLSLAKIGTYNTSVVGGVTYYTQYYIVPFPISFPNLQFTVFANVAGTPFGNQIVAPSIELFVNRAIDTSNVANSSSFTVSVRTNQLGLVPIISWMALGN